MKRVMILIMISVVYLIPSDSPAYCQDLPAFKNPDLPIDQRVNDLVSRMTLKEKVSQMLYNAPAIKRLDIPEYVWWNECLHGVARAGDATVFPQAIALGATWDRMLMHRVATAISDEGRAKHHAFVKEGQRGIYQGLTFWSPNINLFRDPRWGRGMETYGEDPYLMGEMAVQFVKGLQGDHPKYLKSVATVKHFAVHSGPEPLRHSLNTIVNQRDLRQSYLPHFRKSIIKGNAWSVMCAYNRFDGYSCCGSDPLLQDILREKWGFEGYVVSDCGAINNIYQTHHIAKNSIEASALAVKGGTDLNCGRNWENKDEWLNEYENLVPAYTQNLITEAPINTAVRRLFTARFKLGMFDPPEQVPYTQIPYSVVNSEKHRQTAEEAARKCMVLLKNADQTLPLSKNLRSLTVIGPNARDIEVMYGNYNGFSRHAITPLEGIRRKVPHTRIAYAPGCRHAKNMPLFDTIPGSVLYTSREKGTQGLTGEYFDNNELSGKPVFTRIDSIIDFNWFNDTPDERLPDDNFSVRWTGVLVPETSGEYHIGANGKNGYRLYLNDELVADFYTLHQAHYTSQKVKLKEGKAYKIRLEFYDTINTAKISLVWDNLSRDLHTEALEKARTAEAIVMLMGLSPRLEGEEMDVSVEGFNGGDRVTLTLPGVQRELLRDIHALGKPVILVLMNGSPLALPWADKHIPAILEAWYPGEASGTAIADVLFGDYNPAGRLPLTFYESADQLPPFENYTMSGRTYRYFMGSPIYPFGHGLSYTRFEYDNLNCPDEFTAGEPVTISVDVKNTGMRDGEEVVQLYLSDANASVPVPIRSLEGFQRIFLKAGESKSVTFILKPRQIPLIDRDNNRIVEPGVFSLSIGGKQPGFSGNADAGTTDVISDSFRVEGNIYKLGW
ncbi:MAG: glycoside hydrolase family 3 C-terminal domain-containing protein [candidate division KSB1 bacterium]|nr:glycoside hydrolase family 3 C-terminal domain-containing protein [candidate division KSB1 bacterium]